MTTLNRFYKLYGHEKHEYEVPLLSEKIYHEPIALFTDGRGHTSFSSGGYRNTTSADYDGKFCALLFNINPVYKISNCIEYHYEYYCQVHNNTGEEFLNHIQYCIRPHFKTQEIKLEIINNWIKQKRIMLLQKHYNEKNAYLLRAYEEANNYASDSILSVSFNPIELGKTLGFDESTSKRIVKELVAEGLATSTLGMGALFITQSGVQYLRNVNLSVNNPVGINVNVGNYSNVQLQNNTSNSTQTQNINYSTNDLSQFVKDLKFNLDELAKHLKGDDIDDLKSDIEKLERNLQKKNPEKSKINHILNGIGDILKGVTTDVLSSIITNPRILTTILPT